MRPRRTRRAAGPAGPGAPDMPGPAAVEVAARHVRTGDDWSATLAVTGYPAEVSAGWLEPLLSYPGRLDVTLHIEPIPVAVAAARLRRQRARLESGRRAGADRGQLDDPDTEAAAGDARDLAYRLARGEGKLFRLGLYLTVHAGSEEDLAAETAAVRALAASLLLVTVPATFRSLQGWATTLPAGTDQLLLRRTMDTAALAASPSRSPAPTCPATPPPPARCPASCTGPTPPGRGWWPGTGGPPITTTPSPSPPPAPGKSYLAKLEILRSLYQGTECWVIDPEDEYARLAAAVGGAYIHLGAPGVHLNPFDLPAAGRARPDTLTRRALFLHTVIAVLLGGDPSPAERAALDKAIMTAYQQAGITSDARTWARPAPLLPALAAALRAAKTEAATALADRLVPFTEGTHAGLFAAPTTTRPDGHLVVFSPPRRPRRAAARRDPARPGRHLAGGLRPRPAQAAADHRGRGVAADARPRGREIPVPAGEVRPQGVGRARRGHPGRRGRAVHRPGPGGHRQLRHPDPAPPGPPGHRQGRGGVPAVGRGAAAAAVRPPGRGPAGRRAVRPGLVPGPGLARRAFSLHERPGRDRPDAGQPAGGAGPAWPGPDGAADEDGQEDLLP